MGTLGGTSEIQPVGGLDFDASLEKRHMLKVEQKYFIENEINRLFEAIDFKASCLGPSQAFRDKRRPTRAGMPQPSGIGIADPVSLKQALRGLCISQASEMAATKRLSKLGGKPRVSEVETTKNMYRTVVLDASEFGHSISKGKEKLLEISLVPETSNTDLSKLPESQHALGVEVSKKNANCTQVKDLTQMTWKDKEQKYKLHYADSLPDSKTGEKVLKARSISPQSIKSAFRNKNFVKRKMKQDSASVKTSSNQSSRVFDDDLVPCVSNIIGQAQDIAQKSLRKEKERESPASSSTNISSKLNPCSVDCSSNELGFSSECSDRPKTFATKVDEKSGSRHKLEFSQSSKSSIGECSSSTSFTEESNFSGSSSRGCHPHMSRDTNWDAIRRAQNQQGSLGLRHFKLLKKLGGGDSGVVHLGKLTGTNCLFAVKVMDNETLTIRGKMSRVHMEREILQMLDHPFLPTLYAHFVTNKYSCLVMDYCPGGDLHVLRQKQPSKRFSEQAARFYVAEVLLALEYLHMLGVVYRDLKPEHIMIREDGHIMLTDFDLSLRCSTTPTLLKSSPPVGSPQNVSSPCSNSSCVDPFCLQPAWSAPCFKPKPQSDVSANISPLPQLIVEPTSARSNSFVGTPEYLAPEIIKSEGHGSPVDWWTLGVFLYELLYGKTPFIGYGNNEDTFCNVVSECVSFPETPLVSSEAIDLMRRLLEKDPEIRLGSVKGAAEIKQHLFFNGLNWALIRCAEPPEVPKTRSGNATLDICVEHKEGKCETGQHLGFEMF